MDQDRLNVPSYEALLARKDGPPGSSWGLFGRGDEVGTLNFITPAVTARAAGCVRRGATFNLDWPINAFDPPLARTRELARHTIFQRHGNHRDDYLDGFYMQSGSQIDGLRHARHPEHGFYNGAVDENIKVGTPTLGVNRWAERGIVGRGVLADVKRFRDGAGRPIDHHEGEAFSIDDVRGALMRQKTQLRSGDILLIRTGWTKFYFDELTPEERRARRGGRCSGLAQSDAVLSWLWDEQIAMVATDNVAVECMPPVPGSAFGNRLTDHDAGMMHPSLIGLLGLALGELWSLDRLADDCAGDGIHECFLVSNPLYLIGGVGSPANAIAVK